MKLRLTVILLVFGAFSAFSQDTINLVDVQKVYTIGKNVAFFSDSTGKLTLEDVLKEEYQEQFVVSTSDVPNLKNTKSAIWMKFTVNFETEAEWMFQYAAPYIDTVDFYKVYSKCAYSLTQTGTCVPFSHREINTPNFIFQLNPIVKDYYLRIRTDLNPQFPITIMTKDEIIDKNNNTDLVQGFYFGFIILIVLYNFFIWASSRESIYIYYVFYAFVIGFLIFMNKGYAFKFLWPEFHILNRYLYTVASLLSISSVLFAVKFLNMRKYTPVLFKILLGIVVIFGGVIVIDILGFFRLSSMLSKNLSSLLTIIILPATIYIYKKGHKPALFFLIAWGFYVSGALIHLLRLSAVLPYTNFTANSLQIGSALEMILLSFAVADLLNRLKKENTEIIENQKIILEKEVKIRTAELNEKQEEILTQNHELIAHREIIEENQKHTNASINYAKNIQNAVFPSQLLFSRYFTDFFIIFKPRDVVSGDFYWAKEIDGKLYFSVSDCTGHGVPGALVSMLGITLFNEISQRKEMSNTADILNELRKQLKKSLGQKDFSSVSKDGIDTAFCIYDHKTKKLQYSGAYNPLLIIRNQETITLKPNRQPIGVYANEKPFTYEEITLQENDMLYLFSDGIIDQLDDENNEKYKIYRFRKLLLSLIDKDVDEQKKIIENTHNEWRGSFKQIDDILVLGIKV